MTREAIVWAMDGAFSQEEIARFLGVHQQDISNLLRPEKVAANIALCDAVRLGTVKRASNCQQCGKARNTHAHHADYSKPLDVSWLCSACHGKRHRLKPRAVAKSADGKGQPIPIRLFLDQEIKLKAHAAALRVSVSQLIREAVTEKLKTL